MANQSEAINRSRTTDLRCLLLQRYNNIAMAESVENSSSEESENSDFYDISSADLSTSSTSSSEEESISNRAKGKVATAKKTKTTKGNASTANAKTVFMVLPEVSRAMAYAIRNTVNRLAHKELYFNPVVLERSNEEKTYTSSFRNIAQSDNCKIQNNLFRQKHSFVEVKLRVSEEKRTRANMIPVTIIYLLHLQTVLIIAGPGVTI